jgi:hypothetical protein
MDRKCEKENEVEYFVFPVPHQSAGQLRQESSLLRYREQDSYEKE